MGLKWGLYKGDIRTGSTACLSKNIWCHVSYAYKSPDQTPGHT